MFRNIGEEVRRDGELAKLMGLSDPPPSLAATIEAIQAALGRNDLEEAARLFARLRG